MQERYLFKAKRVKDGQWVEGALYMEPYTDRYYIIQWNSTGLGYNEFIEVDGKTACQCTGLKDKNGNMIWENDIVSCKHEKYIGTDVLDSKMHKYTRNYAIEFENTFYNYGLRFINKSIHFRLEDEAKEWLECFRRDKLAHDIAKDSREEALIVAIKALEEVQQYREIGTVEFLTKAKKLADLAKKCGTIGKAIDECAEYEEIGTVEECRVAVEKQTGKKATTNHSWTHYHFYCPICNTEVNGMKYCSNCGQKLDWSDLDGKTD